MVAHHRDRDPNTEPPPEIPEELKGRSCYYGLPMSDEAFKTTSFTAPDDPQRFSFRLRKTSMLLHEMGLFIHANLSYIPVQGSDEWIDCYTFSSDWEVAAKYECPTRAKLEEFCEQLGIPPTELRWRPLWFDYYCLIPTCFSSYHISTKLWLLICRFFYPCVGRR